MRMSTIARLVIPALVALLTLTSCLGGDDTTDPGTTGDSETRSPQTNGPESDSGASPASEEEADLTTESFVMPSGNIGCLYMDGSIRCDILSGLVPEPPVECPVDWTGLSLTAGRSAGPTCAGDGGGWDQSPELEYGQGWSRGDITCDSEDSGLTCTDTSGNGFELARAGWSLMGKEAAAKAAFVELREIVREEAALTGPTTRVLAPRLRFADDCGPLQEAFVQVEFADETQALYTACFTGGWHVTGGPLYVD